MSERHENHEEGQDEESNDARALSKEIAALQRELDSKPRQLPPDRETRELLEKLVDLRKRENEMVIQRIKEENEQSLRTFEGNPELQTLARKRYENLLELTRERLATQIEAFRDQNGIGDTPIS